MAAQATGQGSIDEEECKGCGLCVESCPPHCLELTTNRMPTASIPPTTWEPNAPVAAFVFIVARSLAPSLCSG